MIEKLKSAPGTLVVVSINLVVFVINLTSIGTLTDPYWTVGLLESGALFNPYTLDGEWYRLLTHMFMHGGVIHLAVNVYGLLVIGLELERETGTLKFLLVYFVTGFAAALASLAISIFTISVGASGAILGIYGFALFVEIHRNRQSGLSVTPLLINFAVVLVINLLIAKSVHADTAAHLGGLITGLVIGLYHFSAKVDYRRIRFEYLLIPITVAIFFALPRYQVKYFQVFQQLFNTEERMNNRSEDKHTDGEFIAIYKADYEAVDSTLQMLDSIPFIPKTLAIDTALLRAYLKLMKQGYAFRITMLEKESFIYLDSIQYINQETRVLPRPRHIPFYRLPRENTEDNSEEELPREAIKIWYDSNWIETQTPDAPYYRLGHRDSLGNWDGPVTDYFADGDVQMKGSYQAGQRDGVFIYYSNHKTYESAGRYRNNLNFGKWEYFHPNGKLKSEVYYRNRYFLKNLWDSTGRQLVRNGYGTETYYYPNGVMALTGDYRDGSKDGYWVARYENGNIRFEEDYAHGDLVKGRSFNEAGDVYYYDESSFFPTPHGGFQKFYAYANGEAAKGHTGDGGPVRLSFRVTVSGQITDVLVERSVSPAIDNRAKEILLNGPRWNPGNDHGYQPVDSYAVVIITFPYR